MSWRGLGIALVLSVAFAVWTAPATATVMEEATLEELVLEADLIVEARVVRVSTRMRVDGDSVEPRTFSDLQALRVLKGEVTDRVTIQERGGEWQGGGMRIDGTPEYAVGDEVLVFLVRHPDDPSTYRTHGMVQGRFSITRGLGDTPTIVRRDLHSISFAQVSSSGTRIVPATDAAMRLEDFVAFIQQVLAEGSR